MRFEINTLEDNDRKVTFYTNKTIAQLRAEGVENEDDLQTYERNLIMEDEYIDSMFIEPEFSALFKDNVGGQEMNFNDIQTYYDTVKSYYQSQARGKVSGPHQVEANRYWNEILNKWEIEYKNEWHYNGGVYGSDTDAYNAANNDGANEAKTHCDNFINNNKWIYSWNGNLPIVGELDYEMSYIYDMIQPALTFEITGSSEDDEEVIETASVSFDLIGTDCTIEIGGKVWEDVGATKESSLNGRLNTGGADTGDRMYGGMLVELHLGTKDGEIVDFTTTDSNGMYHFDELNALEKYTVVFTFNGQLYQQTYYKDDLSGGFSNAQEIDREGLKQ